MLYYLLLTSLTVSIDSFFCGFSLSFIKGKKILMILTITLTVLLMCFASNNIVFLANIKNQKLSSMIGGIILLIIGIINLTKKDKEIKSTNRNLFKQSILSGFAVGIDGAIANLSLSLMGINFFYVPIIIAFMHGLLISIGILLAKTIIGKLLEKYNYIPPIILIMLAIYKIASVMITI